jgi:hypothetical protein
VKGCTAHSLKGWEMPALVMGIGVDDRARRLAYVAMTRVARRRDGAPSYVSIISADAELCEFGRTFVVGSAAPAAAVPATPAVALAPPAAPAPMPALPAPALAFAAPAPAFAAPAPPAPAPVPAPALPAPAAAVVMSPQSASAVEEHPLDTSALARFTALLEAAMNDPTLLGLAPGPTSGNEVATLLDSVAAG